VSRGVSQAPGQLNGRLIWPSACQRQPVGAVGSAVPLVRVKWLTSVSSAARRPAGSTGASRRPSCGLRW